MFLRKMPALHPLLVWLCAGCTLALSSAGCRNRDPNLVAVEGQVMLGNKPLTTGYVIFHPDPSKGNNSREEPRSFIDAEGHYRLTTGMKEGVTPGWYKVAVTAAEQTDAKNLYFTKWLIPEKYVDPKTSKLRYEVVANPAPGAYDLKLDPR